MIPAQADDKRSESQRFNAFAKRLLAVPKLQIDRQEKVDLAKSKRRKKG